MISASPAPPRPRTRVQAQPGERTFSIDLISQLNKFLKRRIFMDAVFCFQDEKEKLFKSE
jgi:hypothetical protein